MRSGIAVLAVAALGLVACSQPSPSGGRVGPGSGIEGVVKIGPMCPVERLDSPCPDRPIRSVVTVARDGESVATTRSGKDGRFRLALPPGTYVVRAIPDGGAPPPSGRPVTVEVTAGAFAHVDITLDSGIR